MTRMTATAEVSAIGQIDAEQFDPASSSVVLDDADGREVRQYQRRDRSRYDRWTNLA